MTRLARMGRLLPLACALALGVLSAVLVSACDSGGGGISQANSTELRNVLDEIEQLTDQGECDSAAETAENVAAQIQNANLERDLEDALVDGFRNLATLARDPDKCSGQTTETTETTVTEEEETTPAPTITEEAPPTPTPTPEPPTQTDTGGGGGTGGTGTGGGGVPSP